MSTATWAGSAFRPVLSPSVNRAVRYSFTFSENLTLPLGLLTAHPVRRDEWGEVSTGEVSGVLESNEQLEHSIPAVSIDENLRAQSLLIASYWLNLLTVCYPTSRCSSSCKKILNTSTHPNTEYSNSGVVLSVSFWRLTLMLDINYVIWNVLPFTDAITFPNSQTGISIFEVVEATKMVNLIYTESVLWFANEALYSCLLQRRARCSNCRRHERCIDATPSEGNNSCSEHSQRITLGINKIEHFSSFHNFEYGDTGLRVWKCYGIGKGK